MAGPFPSLPPGFEALPLPPAAVKPAAAVADARSSRPSGRRRSSDRRRGPDSGVSKSKKRMLQRARAKA